MISDRYKEEGEAAFKDGCAEPIQQRRLAEYQNDFYSPGRGIIVRTLWYYCSLLIFENGWFPSSGLKVFLLKLFGANIGRGVVLRPNVRVKYPWKLSVGDDCWIGREVWIDNLAEVTIESDVCLSQGAFLCTGSHDHLSETFDLIVAPIIIKHGAWICCRAIVLGGATVDRLAVISAGVVVKANSSTKY